MAFDDGLLLLFDCSQQLLRNFYIIYYCAVRISCGEQTIKSLKSMKISQRSWRISFNCGYVLLTVVCNASF